MTQAENFRNFLMENEAYEKFCINIKMHRGNSFSSVTDGRKNLSGIIDSELHWDATNEGQDYWSNLNNTWNRACRNGIQFTYGYKSIW